MAAARGRPPHSDAVRAQAASHFRFELGDHPIARALQELAIGCMLSYTYQPDYQVILTPVIESLAA
jgi:hypothetical protein